MVLIQAIIEIYSCGSETNFSKKKTELDARGE